MNIKIQTIGSTEYVRTGHKKQDLLISDSTDVARLTLWEKDTDAFTESQKSYRLENFMVREFNPLGPIAALAVIIDSTYCRRHK